MYQPTDKQVEQSKRADRNMRKALKRIAEKRDSDMGGILIPRQTPHKCAKRYDRKRLRLQDRMEA
jgi:ribosomal protein L44E